MSQTNQENTLGAAYDKQEHMIMHKHHVHHR